jgi:hypothetical protein
LKSYPFSLTKWYLDCVTELGDTAIIYCADLRWHQIRTVFSSILTVQRDSINSRTSMPRGRLPTVDGDILSVELPKFSVSGKWKSAANPVRRTVFEDPSGYIRWNCLQPKSEVDLYIQDRRLRGLGYAECLTLTVPPWRLPMQHLRWGRYLSPEDSLAWVDWQGPYSTCFAFHNGQECQPESVSDVKVVLTDGILNMDTGLALRSGRLGDTLLPGAPALGKLFPHSLFNIEEHKWRSRGSFSAEGHNSSGWVIHEVVHWNI